MKQYSNLSMNALLLLAVMFGSVFGQSVWTKQNSGTTNALNSVTWNGIQFATVGAGSTILTSSNGTTWTTRSFGTTRTLSSVVWIGNRFVAGGDDTVRTSPDGIIWTANYGTPLLTAIAWTGSLVVGAWPGGSFLTSVDGINWTSRTFSYQAIPTYVTKVGSQLWGFGTGIVLTKVAAASSPSQVFYSLDGVSWHYTGIVSATCIAGNGSTLIGVGGGGAILTSPDGASWTTRTSGTPNNLNAITWTGGQFIAVGDTGTILTSLNGVTWTPKVSGTLKNLRSITSTGNLVVTTGDAGAILTSPQDPVSIAPHFSAQDNLPFRLESNQLFATLPSSFLGTNIRASIFTVSGNKMRVVNAGNSATGIAMPLGNLTNGVYLFELQSENKKISQSFYLAR